MDCKLCGERLNEKNSFIQIYREGYCLYDFNKNLNEKITVCIDKNNFEEIIKIVDNLEVIGEKPPYLFNKDNFIFILYSFLKYNRQELALRFMNKYLSQFLYTLTEIYSEFYFKEISKFSNEVGFEYIHKDSEDFGIWHLETFNKLEEMGIINIFQEFISLTTNARNIRSDLLIPIELKWYALLNRFEYRIREVILSKLKNEFGNDFFERGFSSELKEKISSKLNYEKSIRNEIIYQSPLDKCTILEYNKIIKLNWKLFNQIFNSHKELENNFVKLNNLRNNIMHFNKISESLHNEAEQSLKWFKSRLGF